MKKSQATMLRPGENNSELCEYITDFTTGEREINFQKKCRKIGIYLGKPVIKTAECLK